MLQSLKFSQISIFSSAMLICFICIGLYYKLQSEAWLLLFAALLLFVVSRHKKSIALLQRSADIQSVLREIADAAVVSRTLNEFYETIHRLINRVLPAQNFYITLLDDGNSQIVDGYSVDTSNIAPRRRPVGNGLTEYALQQGRTVLVTQAEQERLQKTGEAVSYSIVPICEWLGAPLFNSEGKGFGVMAVVSKDSAHSFQRGDIEVLSIIASQVSMAIERKRAEQVLKESEERYRTLMVQSYDAVILVDLASTEVLEANRKFEELVGYRLPDDSPLYLADFIEDSSDSIKIYIEQLRRNGFLPPDIRTIFTRYGKNMLAERTGSLIHLGGREFEILTLRDVTEEQKRQRALQRDIAFAAKVQAALLPAVPHSAFFRVQTLFRPQGFVSGDTYHFEWLEYDKVLRGYLIDVTGHGLATALQTAAVNVLLHEVAVLPFTVSVSEQLSWLNRHVARYFDEAAFAAAIAFELDFMVGELRYATAGITDFLFNAKRISSPGLFLGVNEQEHYGAQSLPIASGDAISFMTDGITDVLSLGRYWENIQAKDLCKLFNEDEFSQKISDDATAVCIKILALDDAGREGSDPVRRHDFHREG